LKPAKQEAVSLDGSQAVLAEVEAGEVECSTADEQVVGLQDVDVATAVEASQRYTVQLDVSHVYPVCCWRRRTARINKLVITVVIGPDVTIYLQS